MELDSRSFLPVMYHYVRDLKKGLFKGIKGRDIVEFRNQLRWIKNNFKVISGRELIDFVGEGGGFPNKSVVLTFDDGYRDHFDYVVPVLDELKLSGVFFPAAKAIQESVVLDVNKIHFVLSQVDNPKLIVNRISDWLCRNQDRFPEIDAFDRLWQQYAHPGKYDPCEIVFIKNCLQRGLPRFARNELCSALFKEIVTSDEEGFATELYLTTEQVEMMIRHGMMVSSHCYAHEWIDTLSYDEFSADLDKSLGFLKSVSADTSKWIMCYPYGCYPYRVPMDDHVALMKQRGCVMAFTDNGGVAKLGRDNLFMLPRADTNDLPVL